MSDVVQMNYELVGPHAGKTIALGVGGRYQFVNGIHKAVGDAAVLTNVTKILGRFHNAHPVGSDALRRAQNLYAASFPSNTGGSANGQHEVRPAPQPQPNASVSSGVQQNGGGAPSVQSDNGGGGGGAQAGGEGVQSGGGGHENPGVPEEGGPHAAVRKAVASLSVDVKEHWTGDGLPAVAAVDQAAGGVGVTRSMIEAAAPGYTHAMAKAGEPMPQPAAGSDG